MPGWACLVRPLGCALAGWQGVSPRGSHRQGAPQSNRPAIIAGVMGIKIFSSTTRFLLQAHPVSTTRRVAEPHQLRRWRVSCFHRFLLRSSLLGLLPTGGQMVE